jgi:hypothetical protein
MAKIKELLLHIKTIFFAPLPPMQKSPQASSTHICDKKIWTYMWITKTAKIQWENQSSTIVT